LTVRELLEQLDLKGESKEKVYVWDTSLCRPIEIVCLQHEDGKLVIFPF
jgi:hypothetical protein